MIIHKEAPNEVQSDLDVLGRWLCFTLNKSTVRVCFYPTGFTAIQHRKLWKKIHTVGIKKSRK